MPDAVISVHRRPDTRDERVRGTRPSNPMSPRQLFRGTRAAASMRPRRRVGMKKFLYCLAALAVFMAMPSVTMAQTAAAGGAPLKDQQAFDTAKTVAGARGLWLAGAGIGAGIAAVGAGRGIGQI